MYVSIVSIRLLYFYLIYFTDVLNFTNGEVAL